MYVRIYSSSYLVHIYFFLLRVFIAYLRPSCLPFTNNRNSHPGLHSRLSSPLPTTAGAFIFIAGRLHALSPLVHSRRVAPAHATRSQQQSFPFLFLWLKINKTSPWQWDLNSRNRLDTSIRGYLSGLQSRFGDKLLII